MINRHLFHVRTSRFLSIVILILGLASCGGGVESSDSGADRSAPRDSDNLTVFAAASLTEAFAEVKQAFEAANRGTSITYNFGGSQQLATQLIQGADADLFAAADQAQMRAAREAGVIAGEPVVFTRNRLAIIVPRDNPARINSPADLAQDDVKLVVAAAVVPAGAYTRELLDRMSADPRFGVDFRRHVEANVVSHEDNVKQVVAKVRLGEADAGIVYATDVTGDAAQDVRLIEIPQELNVVAEYPIAPVKDGDTELAQAFIDFLLSDAGEEILARHGFTPLS